eukprot:scaffold97496_cov20-Prasinocladus_malaysianus.AAC.1
MAEANRSVLSIVVVQSNNEAGNIARQLEACSRGGPNFSGTAVRSTTPFVMKAYTRVHYDCIYLCPGTNTNTRAYYAIYGYQSMADVEFHMHLRMHQGIATIRLMI